MRVQALFITARLPPFIARLLLGYSSSGEAFGEESGETLCPDLMLQLQAVHISSSIGHGDRAKEKAGLYATQIPLLPPFNHQKHLKYNPDRL